MWKKRAMESRLCGQQRIDFHHGFLSLIKARKITAGYMSRNGLLDLHARKKQNLHLMTLTMCNLSKATEDDKRVLIARHKTIWTRQRNDEYTMKAVFGAHFSQIQESSRFKVCPFAQ